MAINLGTALLQMAGGAAEGYNNEVAKKADSKRKMKERIDELREGQKIRRDDLDFETRYKDHYAATKENESIKAMGGPKSLQALYNFYVVKNKMDARTFQHQVSNGIITEVPVREVPANPMDEVRTPMEAGKAGTPLNSVEKRAARRGNVVADTGYENQKVVPEYVDVPEDIQTSLADFFPPAIPEKSVHKAGDGSLVIVNETEGTSSVIYTSRKDKDTVAGESKDLYRLTDDPNSPIIRPTRMKDGTYTLGGSEIDITKYTPVTEDTSTSEAEAKTRDKKDMSRLHLRNGSLNTAMASLDRYANLSTEEVGGLPGFITTFRDMVSTNIRGISDATGATQALSISDREQVLTAAGLTDKDLLESDAAIYHGMTKAERINMFYTIATTFREAGRRDISEGDIKRTKEVLAGLEGSKERAGAVKTLRRQMQARIREVNLAIFEAPGATKTERLAAGIAFLESPRPNGASLKRNEDYVIINGVIGIRGGKDNNSIIPLSTYLINNPQARR